MTLGLKIWFIFGTFSDFYCITPETLWVEGGILPWTPNHCGEAKSHNNVISTFQNSTFVSGRPQVRTWGANLFLSPGAI